MGYFKIFHILTGQAYIFKGLRDSDIQVPEKFRIDVHGRRHPPFFSLFVAFKCEEEPSFEKWWEWREVHKSKFPPIQDYCETIGNDIDAFLNEFFLAEGREPSFDEFREAFVEWLKSDPRHLLLRVDCLSGEKAEDLKKSFG